MTERPLSQLRLKPLSPSEWLKTTEKELLDGLIKAGGSAVRFVAGEDDDLDLVTARIRAESEAQGYHFVLADPSDLREDGKKPDLHQIDKLFFCIAKTIAWAKDAQRLLLTELPDRGLRMPNDQVTTDIDAVAEASGLDRSEVKNRYQRLVTDLILRDHGMALQLRVALTALGRAQLIPEELSPTSEEVLLGWLRGKAEPGSAATLKRIRIFERINRANAKFMLQSLTHWLPKTGKNGLVLIFDFRPYETVQRTKREITSLREAHLHQMALEGRGASADELNAMFSDEPTGRAGVSYGNMAYIQALEQLRHFIDEIEGMESFLLIVLGSPKFFDGRRDGPSSQRRFTDYDALQTRIGLEVHDSQRQNPSATLVYVGGAK